MINQIPYLEPGNTVAIVSPAKAIESELVESAGEFWRKHGFNVLLGKHCMDRHNYFSATTEDRRKDFQEMLDNPEVKAIICARGGYGCIQFLDDLDWSGFRNSPKWIIGFSDITVFHQHLLKMGFPSIHGTMPLNYATNSAESFQTMLEALQTGTPNIKFPSSPESLSGVADGVLLGGNLSILFSLLGTNSQPNYQNGILFIEDLCEQLYHIDRIFHTLKKTPVLNQIRGLIVGGMTNLQDTDIPFGMDYKEIILSHTKPLGIPVAFDFPAGHIEDNRAMVFGKNARLKVGEKESELTYL